MSAERPLPNVATRSCRGAGWRRGRTAGLLKSC
jgi:hypothetical protein